jgi:hypothetical protein
MPGGHDDKVELRLMAYRWMNRFLKGEDKPVTEAELPKIEGKLLRAFPDELPADEINTKIDETFVPLAANTLPRTRDEFESWRAQKLAELHRVVFRAVPEKLAPTQLKFTGRKEQSGVLTSEPGISVPWKYFPAKTGKSGDARWLVVLGEEDSLDQKPQWLTRPVGDAAMLLVAPRGSGPLRLRDPSPFYIQRSLPLLGSTLDTCRLADVIAASAQVLNAERGAKWHIVGRGRFGVIAAYAALLEPRVSGVMAIDPLASHRDGPIFLNVLRVLDVPEALGMLASRPLTIVTSQAAAFERTRALYRVGSGTLKVEVLP